MRVWQKARLDLALSKLKVHHDGSWPRVKLPDGKDVTTLAYWSKLSMPQKGAFLRTALSDAHFPPHAGYRQLQTKAVFDPRAGA